jgi:hypothetical protein
MKKQSSSTMTILTLLACLALVLGACSPAAAPEQASATPVSAPSETVAPSATPVPASATAVPATATATEAATQTPWPHATETETPIPSATPTLTYSQMMKQRIVFYVIQPEKGRKDACGDIKLMPIISKRQRTGDKVKDVQIALNMLFGIGQPIFITYYNGLWNTNLKIKTFEYIPTKDYMIMEFTGYLPIDQLSKCDKHAIREQIWATFYHYEFKEKTFIYDGKFLIDQLSRK